MCGKNRGAYGIPVPTRSSADADKPARRIYRGQSRTTNTVPFDVLQAWIPISVL